MLMFMWNYLPRLNGSHCKFKDNFELCAQTDRSFQMRLTPCKLRVRVKALCTVFIYRTAFVTLSII